MEKKSNGNTYGVHGPLIYEEVGSTK